MKYSRRLMVIGLIAVCVGCAAAEGPQPADDYKLINGVVYAKVGDRELHLNLAVPTAKSDTPRPLVIWVHGGGWNAGSHEHNRASWMCRHGYVAASVEYRLSGEATFPAHIYDCKAAVRFLRAKAKDYGIDPDRIGVWGGSAGGHLAALLATSGGVKELEGDLGNPDQSSRVQALCDFFGPTNLYMPRGSDFVRVPNVVSMLLGGEPSDKPELAKLASPVRQVTKDDPPTIIFHGDRDPLVAMDQSQQLYLALRSVGVEAKLVKVKGAGHGFDNPKSSPTPDEIDKMLLEFFDKHLKNKR